MHAAGIRACMYACTYMHYFITVPAAVLFFLHEESNGKDKSDWNSWSDWKGGLRPPLPPNLGFYTLNSKPYTHSGHEPETLIPEALDCKACKKGYIGLRYDSRNSDFCCFFFLLKLRSRGPCSSYTVVGTC